MKNHKIIYMGRKQGIMTKLIEKNIIMNEEAIRRSIKRIAHEIIEKNKGTEKIVLVGIRTRGVPLAHRIADAIHEIEDVNIPVGILDITLYRDDLSTLGYQPIVHATEISADITGKSVVLVDDVLYSGRTIRAAMDAIVDFGRPKNIRLAVLIDRGHRELPIRADFVGKNVPTAHKEEICVFLKESDQDERVVIYEKE